MEHPAPEPSGIVLTFEGQSIELYRLDGLLWLRKDTLSRVLGGQILNHGQVFRRHFGVWATRIVALPPLDKPEAPPVATRLLTMYGAAAVSKLSASPQAPAFVAWALALEADPEAPAGLSCETWKAPTTDEDGTCAP